MLPAIGRLSSSTNNRQGKTRSQLLIARLFPTRDSLTGAAHPRADIAPLDP
jgi:hypothetical protein